MSSSPFDSWRRERKIRRVLRQLTKQRVVSVLQPGDVSLVEFALDDRDPETVAALKTAEFRGWVEIYERDKPHAWIHEDGSLPLEWEGTKHQYRLTEGGWAVINRVQAWIVATFIVSVLGLAASLAALLS